MTLYLITKSQFYYPAGGSGDFVFITNDEDEARGTFKSEVESEQSRPWAGSIIYLLALTPEGWTELESQEVEKP